MEKKDIKVEKDCTHLVPPPTEQDVLSQIEKKTFAEHVKERMATLLPHDHHLFDELVKGLVTEGWTQKGGSPTYRLLNKQGAAIKIFRNEEAPAVIKICFSAEPEEKISEPEIDKVRDV